MANREPMTLRKLIDKLRANDQDHGDQFLDLPITFLVRDGYRHSSHDAMDDDEWPHRHYGYPEGDYKGELRFDVYTGDYRMVAKKGKS